MGLPVWREPPRRATKKERFERLKAAERAAEAEACARVSGRVSGGIRRRAWMGGRPPAGSQRAQMRQRSLYPPLLDAIATTAQDNVPTNRASEDNRIPHVPALLEHESTERELSPIPVIHRPDRAEADRIEAEYLAARDRYEQRRRQTVTQDRFRLIAETRNTLARLGGPVEAIPPPPPYSPPSPGTSERRLRRARSLTEFLTDDRTPRPQTARIDGLGDRNRSPTPAEAWEVIRTTIQPDATLPSQESSFTSALASQSFNAGANGIAITTTQDVQAALLSDSDSDSGSSIDLAEICVDEAGGEVVDTSDQLARDMYYSEMETLEGRTRIAEQEEIRAREGNRFALADEAAIVDIGFRLIEAALERVEERHRDLRLRGQASRTADYGPDLTRLSNAIDVHRARQRSSRSDAAQETSADAVGTANGLPTPPEQSQPYVVPSEEEVMRRLDRGEQDIGAVRHIVEVLASRDDIPDEWWSSMGLNLSRSRPRRNRDATQGAVRESRVEESLNRVHTGRIERERQTRDDARDNRGSRL